MFGAAVLDTYIMHKTGQWILLSTPIIYQGASNPNQALGSAVTYAQRRAIRTGFAVPTEEDDDANGADGNEHTAKNTGGGNNKPPKKATSRPKATPPKPRPAAAKPAEEQPPADDPPADPAAPRAAKLADVEHLPENLTVEQAEYVLGLFKEHKIKPTPVFNLVKDVAGLDPPPNVNGAMGRAIWRRWIQAITLDQAQAIEDKIVNGAESPI